MVKGLEPALSGGEVSNVSYQYDIANRLADVNGVAYTYDNNGNLLADGANTYTYDSANRLSSMSSEQGVESSFLYNGLGDRLSQNGVNYTLDLNTGLTQVLSDGKNTYNYGLGRISQRKSGNAPEYFLGDALGSVRQMTDQAGAVTYAASYDPYGVVTQSGGVGQSAYGYTGEQQSGDLVYLRARYVNVNNGRFLSRDTWEGDKKEPMSYNLWNYTNGNPVNLVAPSGFRSQPPNCQDIIYPEIQKLCLQGIGSDTDPTVLKAREQFFRKISDLSLKGGMIFPGLYWSGRMLKHFLDGDSIAYISLGKGGSTFGTNRDIERATKKIFPPQTPSDEPDVISPLLVGFVEQTIHQCYAGNFAIPLPDQTVYGKPRYSTEIDGLGTPSTPRPWIVGSLDGDGIGWWGAWAHVVIDGHYSNAMLTNAKFLGIPWATYKLTAHVVYTIDDIYAWTPGRSTPLPLGLGISVWVPHEWELSLEAVGAFETHAHITWFEDLRVLYSQDFQTYDVVSD